MPLGAGSGVGWAIACPGRSAQSLNGTAKSLDGVVQSFTGTAKSLDGAVQNFTGTAKSLDGTVQDFTGAAKSLGGTVQGFTEAVKSLDGAVHRLIAATGRAADKAKAGSLSRSPCQFALVGLLAITPAMQGVLLPLNATQQRGGVLPARCVGQGRVRCESAAGRCVCAR